MTTPLLGLPEIAEGVANQAPIHNTALRQLEARSFRVLSLSTTVPPAAPSESHSYIIPAGATGVWTGKTNQIASWVGGAWVYYVPLEGIGGLWVNDLDTAYSFDGANWIASGGVGATAPFVDGTALVKGSLDATKQLKIEVDGFTTATTRTLTPQDKSYVIADKADLDAHNAAVDPHSQYALESTIGAANGIASLGADGKVPPAQLPATTAQPFDLTAFYPGVPTASAIVTRVPVARAVTFPAALAGSIGRASAAATAATVFDIQKNGASVGSMTFAAAAASATFTAAAAISLVAGDVLSIHAPATADTTLANIGLVLAGTR